MASIEISPLNKDNAAKAHQQRLQQMSRKDLVMYTDGSGHNGHIGAAIHSPTINLTKGKYVGTDKTHNVYAAELIAIQMATKLFAEKLDEYSNAYIFVDSQPAIQAVASPKRQSGQYIVKNILDAIDRIYETNPTCNIHIEWVPGHKSITGNEHADQAAKAAATPNTLSRNTPRMQSAQRSSIQCMTKTQWETEWKTGRENAMRLRRMSQHPDTTTGPKLYGTLQQ